MGFDRKANINAVVKAKDAKVMRKGEYFYVLVSPFGNYISYTYPTTFLKCA
jgi:hypothetical protein